MKQVLVLEDDEFLDLEAGRTIQVTKEVAIRYDGNLAYKTSPNSRGTSAERRAYHAQWRRKNPEKVKKYQEDHKLRINRLRCPECGVGLQNKAGLGNHRWLIHGIPSANAEKNKRDRERRNEREREQRKSQVKEVVGMNVESGSADPPAETIAIEGATQ